jgi:hypothetical protein
MNIVDAINSDFLTTSDKNLSETGSKILSFGRLSKGWHFGQGSPPNGDLIKQAIELDDLSQDLGFTNTDAFPGPNGELRFCVYEDENYYEFTLEIDGSVTAVMETVGVEMEASFSFEEARNFLKRISIWNTSDSFIGSIGTKKERISRAWPFRTHPRTKQYQWLTESAQNDTGPTYALGLISFTPSTPRVSPFGFSTTNYYLTKRGSQTREVLREMSAIETYAA